MIINTSKPCMLIDTSYFVFYRYYATLNWYKYREKDVNVSELLDNTVYIDKYKSMFEKTLIDLVKKSKVSWEDVIFCKDAPRDELWRYQYFAEYKNERDEKQHMFNKDIFRMTYKQLIPDLQQKHGFKVLEFHSMEADDIIAIVKNAIREHCESTHITIVTNDNDYIQLYDDNTSIINLQGKELKSRISTDPCRYLNLKIIMGDKSDCIPPIQKNVGPKTAEKLAMSSDLLAAFFDKNPCAKKQYDLNRLLIDMNEIPQAFKDVVREFIKCE